MKAKVFGIGAAKTGTSSLAGCLRILGFRHKTYDQALSRQKYAEGDYDFILDVARQYDSFDDGPWNRGDFYKLLDTTFPGSKFILTVRPTETWLRSHEKHFSTEGLRNIPQEIRIKDYEEKRDAIVAAYEKRNREVMDYFRDRPDDLLVIDICSGEGWERICRFLDVPVPDAPFPHFNKTPPRQNPLARTWRRVKEAVASRLGK